MTAPDHPADRAVSGEAPQVDSLSVLFAMMYGNAIGYVLVLLSAYFIARRAAWQFGPADVVFILAALGIPLARRVAARQRGGRSGAAGGVAHLVVAGALWALVQTVHLDV